MRATIVFLVLVLLTSLGFADVRSAVPQLDAAVTARIAAIGQPPANKHDATEAKNLEKAHAKLAAYDGKNTVDSWRKVAVAGSFVVLSDTADAAVLAGLTALVEGFADGAQGRLDAIVDTASQFIDPKHTAVVEAASAAARAILAKGRAAIAGNPVKASTLLITAYDQLGLILFKARNLATAELGSPPPVDVSVVGGVNSLALMNSGAGFYDISKIKVFVLVSSNGNAVKTYAGQDAKSVVAGLFAVKGSNRIAAGTSFDLMPVVSGLVPAATPTPRVSGVFQVTLKGEAFFNVYFDITLP